MSFPLYINKDGSIGKRVDLGNGGYMQINDATMVKPLLAAERKFREQCNEFHEKLLSMGVKTYRCNDGWVDRKNCIMTIFLSEHDKGYYYYGGVKVGDKIFIGNAHDGGRFAEVTKVEEGFASLDVSYKPLEETLDGFRCKYITINNAPKLSFWDRLLGKEQPYLSTDIYE